jgi:3-oxoadipate enol-lactonase
MERHVAVPGGSLFVVDEGSGPPIVLVHASIANHRAWDALVPLLIGAGYRSVRYDLRGWGRSTTEAVAFSSRADLVAVLVTLGIERAALVGNSVGAIIALDTALEHPERIVAAVPIAAYVGGSTPPATDEEKALFDEMERLESLDPPDVDAIVEFDVACWVDGPGQPAGRGPVAVRQSITRWDREANDPTRTRGKAIQLDPPAFGRLSKSGRPILAISGELDFSDTRWCGRLLVERADARHVVVPGVAHMVAMEAPEAVASLVVDFLEPLRPWS